MIRFDITYLLPSRDYSINNFTLSYLVYTNTAEEHNKINKQIESPEDTTVTISVITISQRTVVTRQHRNQKGELIVFPIAKTLSTQRNSVLNESNFDSLWLVGETLNQQFPDYARTAAPPLFIEAQYV